MDGNALTAPVIKLSTPENKLHLAELETKAAAIAQQLEASVAKLTYQDPASVVPLPPVKEEEKVLVEDNFPQGASIQVNPAGSPVKWVDAMEHPGGAARARCASPAVPWRKFLRFGAAPIEVPPGARFVANVFIDPAEPPRP